MIRTFVSEVKVQINNTLECLKLYVHSLKMGGGNFCFYSKKRKIHFFRQKDIYKKRL